MSNKHPLTRRALLSQAAAAGAVATLATAPALAHPGQDDAELKALWRDYLSASHHYWTAVRVEQDADNAADESIRDDLAEIDAKEAAAKAAADAHHKDLAGKVRVRIEGVEVPEKAQWAMANIVAAFWGPPSPERQSMAADRERIRQDAKRRHGVPELKAASNQAWEECTRIAEQIDEMPAHTFAGVAIKMAYEVACGVETGIEMPTRPWSP